MGYFVDKLQFNLMRTIPMVYDNSMSLYELVSAVISKLNEIIDDTNDYFSTDLETYATTIIQGWKDDGTLANIVDPTHIDVSNYKGLITERNTVSDPTQWDWTPAIQQAVNDAISLKRRNVFFPDLYYLIKGTVTVNDHLTLYGVPTTKTFAGQDLGGSVLVGASGTNAPVIQVTVSGDRVVGFGLRDLNFLGGQNWDDFSSNEWVDRPAIELDAVCREVDIQNVTIVGFKRGGLKLSDVWDGNVYGLSIMHSGTDGTYPALYITGTSGDNSNALRFYGIHLEQNPYMIHIDGGSRHIQFIGGKIEQGVSGNNSPIQIDASALEINFISLQLVHNNVSDYVASGFANGQYLFQIANDKTRISHCQATTPPNTNYDGALWINHTGNGGMFTDNLFDNAHGGDYAFKIGDNSSFKDNTVDLLTTSGGVRYGLQLGTGNDLSGNMYGDNSGNTPTSGTQYHITGTQNTITDQHMGIESHTLWDGSTQNFVQTRRSKSVNTWAGDGYPVGGERTLVLNPPGNLTLTNFTGGQEQQLLTVFNGSSNTITFNNSGNFALKGYATSQDVLNGQAITFMYTGTTWFEIARNF